MASKYASLSPYVYCADNPVKLVDPNGEEIDVPGPDDPPQNKNLPNQQTPNNAMALYYRQQYRNTDDFTIKISYGLKFIGLRLNFNEQHFINAAAPYIQGAVLYNPLVGIPNDIKSFLGGSDIYGSQLGFFDKFMAGFDALTFSVAKKMEIFGTTLSKGFEKAVNYFNFTSTSYSAGSTIKNQKSQQKGRENNEQR